MAALLAMLLMVVVKGTGDRSDSDTVSLVQHASAVQVKRGDDTVRLVVKDESGKELHLEARKSTRLGKLIDVVCKRLDLEKEYAHFQSSGREISTFDTVDEFGLEDEDVIEVTGGNVRNAPARREVSRLHARTSAQAVAAVASTTPAAQPVAATPRGPPPIPVLQAGDFSYVNISSGADTQNVANVWAPCSVVGKGSGNHSYNIHFIYAPDGLRDSHDVPAQLLRKVDGRRYAEAIQYYREDTEAVDQVAAWVRAREEVRRAAEEAKEAVAAAEKAAAAAEKAAAEKAAASTAEGDAAQAVNYQVGDFVEVRLEKTLSGPAGDISWVPCRLLGAGVRNGTYQVHFLFGPPGHADLTNISKGYLRKIGTRDFAEKSREIKRDTQQAQQAVLQLAEEAANRTKVEEEKLRQELLAREAEAAAKKAAAEAAKRERELAKKLAKEAAEKEAADRKVKRERELARRAEEEKEAKRLAEFVYTNGANVLVKLDKALKGTSALPGKVLQKGTELSSFDIHFEWAPPAQQDIANVPAAYLQPVDAEQFVDLMQKFSSDPSAAQAAFAQVSKEAGRRMRALAAQRRAEAAADSQSDGVPSSTAAFAVGDSVEMKLEKSVKDLSWVPCTVTAAGSKKNTFNVHFAFEVPKHGQEIKGVPADSLRKADSQATRALELLTGDAELAKSAMVDLEKQASKKQRQDDASRRKRQETKAAPAKS